MGILPRHKGRTEPRHDGVGTSRMAQFRSRFIQHAKDIWPDVLTIAILGGFTLGIHQLPLAARRTFPIVFDANGDIVYPTTDMAYPMRGWIISTSVSGVVTIFGPVLFVLLTQIRVRSLWDATNGIMGVLYANICSTIFQVLVKKLIGGFRPWFLEACQPDTSLAKGQDGGLNGSGFRQVFYTIDICTNPDKRLLTTAATSFPSGHTVAAFAGYGFLFLYWNAKFKVWSDHRPALWKIWTVYAPLLAAFLMACAVSIDAAHNWYDIAVGMVIGIIFAFGVYRIFYAAIWDWRYNHIPLMRTKAHPFTADHLDRANVFTRAGGWGDDRVSAGRNESGAAAAAAAAAVAATSARSSTTIPNHSRRSRGDGVIGGEQRQGDDIV